MLAWLSAFLFTIAFELPIFAWGMRRTFPDGRAIVALAATASFATHPFLWAYAHRAATTPTGILCAEFTVTLVEAMIISRVWSTWGQGQPSPMRCAVVSFFANGFSFGLGLLLFT